jgi:hypothetical protein
MKTKKIIERLYTMLENSDYNEIDDPLNIGLLIEDINESDKLKEVSLIHDHRVADLLCGAFDGGSNYWYSIENYVIPESLAKPWGSEYTPQYVSIPMSKGGAVIIVDNENPDSEKFTLDQAAIERGKKLIETDYKSDYIDILKENDDANTSDVFLQLCLFNKVIYA